MLFAASTEDSDHVNGNCEVLMYPDFIPPYDEKDTPINPSVQSGMAGYGSRNTTHRFETKLSFDQHARFRQLVDHMSVDIL